MISARLIRPFAEAYAAHVGSPVRGEALRADLERRLGLLPPWARAYLAASAVAVRRLFPLLLLGRWRSFDALSPDEREDLLSRAQCDPRAPVRAAFVGAKTLALAACYGRPEFLAKLGAPYGGGHG